MTGHIIPVDDLGAHMLSCTCPCEPSMQVGEDGNTLTIHTAYDGRELLEEACEILQLPQKNCGGWLLFV